MLSIILVTYRSWELLEENIRHLRQSAGLSEQQSDPWEIIVVNNNADHDREQGEAFARKFPQVRLLQAFGDRGYAYSCNRGAEAATGDFFLFGGADLKMEADQLEILLAGARKYSDYAILTAPQDDRRGRLQRSFAPFTRVSNYFSWTRWLQRRVFQKQAVDPRTPPEQLPEMVPVDWVSGSLVFMSRGVFNQLGGWNEDLWLYCEDEDLCRRAHQAGLKVGYYTPPRFIHAHAVSTRGTVRETALYKSEVVISKQVYLAQHEANFFGHLLRGILRYQTHLGRPLWELFSLLTFQKVDKIELKKWIHRRLRNHYRQVRQTGILLSEYAPNHPSRGPLPVEEVKSKSLL